MILISLFSPIPSDRWSREPSNCLVPSLKHYWLEKISFDVQHIHNVWVMCVNTCLQTRKKSQTFQSHFDNLCVGLLRLSVCVWRFISGKMWGSLSIHISWEILSTSLCLRTWSDVSGLDQCCRFIHKDLSSRHKGIHHLSSPRSVSHSFNKVFIERNIISKKWNRNLGKW